MADAFAVNGHPAPSSDVLRRYVGLNLEQTMSLLVPDAPSDHHLALADEYRTVFRRMRAAGEIEEPLFPGARATVRALEDAGFLLAVATGKGRPGVNHMIDTHRFEGTFISLQTPESAPGKPHPGMLENAMADAGVTREDTMMIGDTHFDIEMAVNAGVASIGVTWGFHPAEDLTSAGATYLIDHFDELVPTLERHWAYSK